MPGNLLFLKKRETSRPKNYLQRQIASVLPLIVVVLEFASPSLKQCRYPHFLAFLRHTYQLKNKNQEEVRLESRTFKSCLYGRHPNSCFKILGRAKCETFEGVFKNVLGGRVRAKPKGDKTNKNILAEFVNIWFKHS